MTCRGKTRQSKIEVLERNRDAERKREIGGRGGDEEEETKWVVNFWAKWKLSVP